MKNLLKFIVLLFFNGFRLAFTLYRFLVTIFLIKFSFLFFCDFWLLLVVSYQCCAYSFLIISLNLTLIWGRIQRSKWYLMVANYGVAINVTTFISWLKFVAIVLTGCFLLVKFVNFAISSPSLSSLFFNLSTRFNLTVCLDAADTAKSRVPMCLAERDPELAKKIEAFIRTVEGAVKRNPSAGFSLGITLFVIVSAYYSTSDFFKVLRQFSFNKDFFNNAYPYLLEVIDLIDHPDKISDFAERSYVTYVQNAEPDKKAFYLTAVCYGLNRIPGINVQCSVLSDKQEFVKAIHQAFVYCIKTDGATDKVFREFSILLDQIVYG